MSPTAPTIFTDFPVSAREVYTEPYMKTNPLFNALAAGTYILMVVGVIYALQSPNTPDKGILAPLFLLGLFTLSAAVMAFLFFFQPFKLYFENRQKDALAYFMKTLWYFSIMVFLLFFTLLYFRVPNTITFPNGGEKLIQGQSYELTWSGGREEITQIFLIDTSLEDRGVSVSISDRIYGIENAHRYTYTVPLNIPPGTYRFQIGSQKSQAFDIVAK